MTDPGTGDAPPTQHLPQAIATHLAFKPSLLAAADILLKIFATITAFFLPILVGLALAGNPIGFAAAVGALGGAQGFGLLYGIAAAFLPLVKLAFTRYEIDEEGIHVHTKILSKTSQRVSWEKVTLLRQQRTILDKALGIDRLDVVAYGARGTTLHLIGLRDVDPIRTLIAKRMRQNANLGALMRSD